MERLFLNYRPSNINCTHPNRGSLGTSTQYFNKYTLAGLLANDGLLILFGHNSPREQ